MHINLRADYAVRTAVELAGSSRESPRKRHEIAAAQAIPAPSLIDILRLLRSASVIRSQRGAGGGYWLARPADEIDVGCVIRAVEGPLLEVRGQARDGVGYVGSAIALQRVWSALRTMLERVTIADLAAGQLPPEMLLLLVPPRQAPAEVPTPADDGVDRR